MAGAFTAVTDDASAVFWNPAGHAAGAYFSLVIDRNQMETADASPGPRRQSAFLTALGTPPLGLAYYRTSSIERSGDGTRFEKLVAQHAGVTLVQSIATHVAVGATLKLVRGVAAAGSTATLDAADDLEGRASNTFDADIGVMVDAGTIRLGLTVRNALEPKFDVPGGDQPLVLDRRVRGGIALRAAPGLTIAADADFTRVPTSGGEWRDAAIGAEARLTARAWGRGGVHWNTAGADRPGAAPVVSAGGSYLLYGSLFADGQITFGSDDGNRGWGVGARIVF
jgi:hypothetical protein